MVSAKLLSTLLPLLTLSAVTSAENSTPPKFRQYGFVLFRAVDPIDVWGSYEILQHQGRNNKIDIALIAETMDPVKTEPAMPAMNPMNSSVWPLIPPTHTFDNAPELDVLIIPGGPGMRADTLNRTLEYIAKTAPKVKHILTVCTGSALAARAGIMNGKKATTNKTSWPVQFGPNTTWIGRARWVEDDSGPVPIWSSSGITSGMDLTFHFVEQFYSAENATRIATIMEYVRNMDKNNDPFARNETVYPVSS